VGSRDDWFLYRYQGTDPEDWTNVAVRRATAAEGHVLGYLGVGHRTEGLMRWEDRISIDPRVLAGKPVIRGTRLAVEFIVGLLAQGWTEAQILDNYPGVTHDDVLACLRYASEVLKSERVFPIAARS